MLQYLQFKSNPNSKNKFIVFRERKKKFDKKVKETYVSKRKSLGIFGLNASGKSKELKKLWEAKKEIWNKKNFIMISAKDSLSEWIHKNIRETDTIDFTEEHFEDFHEIGLSLDRELNKQYVKTQILVNKSNSAILFVDDLDSLSGKKLEIAKEMIRNSSQVIFTASSHLHINKTIASILKTKNIMELNLKTEASYDATNTVLAMFIISLFVTGNYELAMLVMAARFMSRPKATK